MKVEACSANEAIPKLSVALNGYDALYIDQINRHLAEAWRINDGESYAITRVEPDNTLTPPFEFVLCCYEGKHVEQFVEYLKETLKNKVGSIRCHVTRKGFAKLAERLGFEKTEVVYRYGF